ncbi:MAG: DNA repair protein RadC [Sphingopyxis sp.]|jgi:DNA repair protein RadC|nr:DNA repair protein RadC [Sphingopyxis sp.]
MESGAGPVGAENGDHAGHRARLRQRLLTSGGDALADHELIECLLTFAIPRRDTKPLAKALLREFGGIGPLMSADAESLRRVSGMGETSAAMIRIVQATLHRVLKGAVIDRPVLGSWQGLLDYLRADMAYRINERVRVLHLDSRNHLIRDEVVSDGSIDQSAIYIREVVRRALELGSAAIILVHNHPSGDTSPSRQDIAITRDIADACKRLGIALHDHIIIGAHGHTSLRTQGLI